jgi:hypothetical protein
MSTRTTALLTSALLALAGSVASAQEQIYLLGLGATNGDAFGHAVGDAGDVDLDGVPDVVVGSPFDDPNGNDSGAAIVYSGRTGNIIWSQAGEAAGDSFGWSVDRVGDINGDGRSEIIVGAPGHDFPTGSANGGGVYLLHGFDGSVMGKLELNEPGAQLGYEVCGLGDVNGDGVADFAYGAPYRDAPALGDAGYVAGLSGATFALLFSRFGPEAGALYGYSLDVVQASGHQASSLLVVGAPRVDGAGVDRGQAELIDAFGNHHFYFGGSTDHEWFGASVAGVGDANNDGWRDFAFGSPYLDVLGVGADAGGVRVYSGGTWGFLFSVSGATANANLGWSLAGVGDFDGNGHDDFLVGAPDDSTAGVSAGETRLVSGSAGVTLHSWTGGLNDRMGYAVSPAGDLNGDGFTDLVFGARNAPFGAGEAYVHLAQLEPPTVYCTAKVNSQGCTPQVSTQGTPSVSLADDFVVIASNVINQKAGICFWGYAPKSAPFKGGTLCVQSPIKRTPLQTSGGNAGPDDCSGSYAFHVSHAYMAAHWMLPGGRVHAQFWSRDPASSYNVGLTDAVAFDLVP